MPTHNRIIRCPHFSRRTIAFIGIIGLHVVLIYALATGLTHDSLRRNPIWCRMGTGRAKHAPPPPPLPHATFSPEWLTFPGLILTSMSRLTTRAPSGMLS